LKEQYPEKNRGKTSTTILKASRQKQNSNEENALQQFQMESCQPIKRLEVKIDSVCSNLAFKGILFHYKSLRDLRLSGGIM
jgi:hypothetical protein